MERLFKACLNKWAVTVLLPGFAFMAGGCASSSPSQPSARPARAVMPALPPPPTPAASDKRFIIAPELTNVLHVVNVRLTHPEDTYLKIQVTIQNMTDKRQHFNYHIDWFDQNGTMLPSETDEFLPWMLLPNEVTAISATAPMPTATDFGIAFLPADK